MENILKRLDEFKRENVIHTGWKVIRFDKYEKGNVDVTSDIRELEREILNNNQFQNEERIGKYFQILQWMEQL
jgi:hypothetical protein